MDVWLMTDPIFWVTFGVWFGFLIGLWTGALVTWGAATQSRVQSPRAAGEAVTVAG
jgi:hypothetical protein